MKIVAIVNTPYQTMCVAKLKMDVFPQDEMDVIVSDHISNGEELAKGLKKCGLFGNIHFVSSFGYCRKFGKYASKYYRLAFGNRVLREMIQIDQFYDVLLISNFDPFADRLYERCLSINKKILVYAFEDGYGTYVNYEKSAEFIRNMIKTGKKYSFFKALGRKWVVLHIKRLYLFAPEAYERPSSFEIMQIPKIKLEDTAFRDVVNQIFDYNNVKDQYNAKYIFFEESYRREGIVLPDIVLVEMIASWVGKENIMIKVHPRSNNSLFKELGYHTNENTFIPWEVIWMNQGKYSEKILISISSGSVSTPVTLMDGRVKGVVLKNLLYGVGVGGSLEKYHNWLDKNIYTKYTDMFFLPQNIGELKEYFEKEKRQNFCDSGRDNDESCCSCSYETK